MPLVYKFLAVVFLSEHVEEALALLEAALSVGVGDRGHFFHELEVGSHSVRKTCHGAKFRDEDDLHVGLLVGVDDEWLVDISDLFLILLLVVVHERNGTILGLENVSGVSVEVDVVDAVGFLVVHGKASASHKVLQNLFLEVAAAVALGLVDDIEHCLVAQNSVAHIHVEHDSLLEVDE